MTATEQDLRDALRLLEERAPEVVPDVSKDAAPVRRRRGTIAQIVAVAALVLVVAGGVTVLGMRHNRVTPTQRSGPISVRPAKPPKTQAAAPATLRVRVVLFGGPARPNGKAALSGSPDAHTAVTLISAATGSGAYESSLTVRESTDAHGIATFSVPPGRYRYRSGACGSGVGHHAPVSLHAGQTASVQIRCAVP